MLVIKILLLEYSSTFYSVHDWYLTDPSLRSDSHAVSDVAFISVVTTSLGSEGILASLGVGCTTKRSNEPTQIVFRS